MLIVLLIINALAEAKLAARGITADEIGQVRDNGPFVARNPHPRVPGSRLMIGRTNGGRILSAVIQPDASDSGVWHVMTAWRATRREQRAFRYRR